MNSVHINWSSTLGDFTIEVTGDTVEDTEKLLNLAKKANKDIMSQNIKQISKKIDELIVYNNFRKGIKDDDE